MEWDLDMAGDRRPNQQLGQCQITVFNYLCQCEASILYPFIFCAGVEQFTQSPPFVSIPHLCVPVLFVCLWLCCLFFVSRGSCRRGLCPGHPYGGGKTHRHSQCSIAGLMQASKTWNMQRPTLFCKKNTHKIAHTHTQSLELRRNIVCD